MLLSQSLSFLFFFFNDTATTEIYTLSLHDALPILPAAWSEVPQISHAGCSHPREHRTMFIATCGPGPRDRKSTRLNSSHQIISYAVFCLKKKKQKDRIRYHTHGTRDDTEY